MSLCKEHGFTLIEMIGVISIMAILAAVIAPNVIKQMQSARQDVEDVTLSLLADALENYVLENRIIPQSGEGSGAWADYIATQADLPTKKIYENDLGCSRRYWFDPDTDLDGLTDNTDEYDQDTVAATDPPTLSGYTTGLTAPPDNNPRAMIISDLATGCVNNILVSSVGHTIANFDAVWEQTGTLTESSTLKIERINFSQVFETVTLQAGNGSIFSRKTYSNPNSATPYTGTPGPQGPTTIITVEKNSHIFSVSYSTGGFEPTNIPGGSAALDIGYTTPYYDQFVSSANVITGVTSGPVSVTYTSTDNIDIDLVLTISGTNVYNGNSGYIDTTVEYAGEPQYKLEGQEGNPTTISLPSDYDGTLEIVSFNVINGTELSLYDQSWTGENGDLLHSIVIKESESFAYTPGPPTLWGR